MLLPESAGIVFSPSRRRAAWRPRRSPSPFHLRPKIGTYMTNRHIVRDPAIAAGRWRFENTSIFIDDMTRDFARDPETMRAAYQLQGLSLAELDAALAFDFPVVRDVQIHVRYIDVEIDCVCGIHRSAKVDPENMNLDICPCGRRWHIEAGARLATDWPLDNGVPV